MIAMAPRASNSGPQSWPLARPLATQYNQAQSKRPPTANASRFADEAWPVIEKKGTCRLIRVKRIGLAAEKSSMLFAATNPLALCR